MSWQDLAPLWSPVGLLLFGLCTGSFINVVVRRLPIMMERQWWGEAVGQLADDEGLRRTMGQEATDEAAARQTVQGRLESRLLALPPLDLNQPRSHCPACGHRLRWHENLPVLGWLRLRGRCSACGVGISARYPLVELLTGVLFVAMGWRWGFTAPALLWSAWAGVLLSASLIDWDTTLLPDPLTLPLMWCGLVVSALGWTVPLPEALWGAVGGYASLWVVAAAFERVTGKEGMGRGDFKLLAALGAWLGASLLLPIVLAASLAGAVVGLTMKARGSLREGRYVPFGPFLAAGGLMAAWLDPHTVRVWMGWA